MAQLDVAVAGRVHRLACEDGQETRLRQLADRVDAEARTLAAEVGPVGEARLLLMTALVLADRLEEADAALKAAEKALAEAPARPAPRAAAAPGDALPGQPGLFDDPEEQAALLEAVDRLEAVVAKREE